MASAMAGLSPARMRLVDTLGTGLGSLCAFHCAVVPLLVPLLSAIGLGALASERLELALISFAGLFAVVAAWSGYRIHRRKLTPAVFGMAALAIAAGTLIGEGALTGRALVIVGALGLAGAHLLNRRHCRCCAQ